MLLNDNTQLYHNLLLGLKTFSTNKTKTVNMGYGWKKNVEPAGDQTSPDAKSEKNLGYFETKQAWY